MNRLGWVLGSLLVAVLMLVSLASLAVRVSLASLDTWQPLLSETVAEALGAQSLTIQQAHSDWAGVHPTIELRDVTVQFSELPDVQSFEQVFVNVDLLRSVGAGELIANRITLVGGSVWLKQLEDGGWSLAGIPLQEMKSKDSGTSGQLHIRNLQVTLQRHTDEDVLNLGHLNVDASWGLQGFQVVAHNRDEMDADVAFEGQVHIDLQQSGRASLRLSNLHWAQVEKWIPTVTQETGVSVPGDMRFEIISRATWESMETHTGIARIQAMPSEDSQWKQMAGLFKWQQQPDYEVLELEDLQWDGRPGITQARWRRSSQGMSWILEDADVVAVQQIAHLLQLDDATAAMPIQAEAGKLLQIHGVNNPEGRFNTRLTFQDVQAANRQTGFQVSGLHGTLDVSDSQLQMVADSDNLIVSYAPWGLEDFQVGSVRLNANGPLGDSCCAINLTQVEVSGPALDLRGSGWVSSDQFQLSATIPRAELAQVAQRIPQGLFEEKDERWLRTAFQKGNLNDARLNLQTPLSGAFNASPDAVFTLAGHLEAVDLDYDPGLPLFRNLHGRLFLDRNHLHVTVQKADVLKSHISHGAVRIEDLSRADLYLSGISKGPATDLIEYLRAAEALQPGIEREIRIEGNSELKFQVNVPLAYRQEKELQTRSVLTLENNRLTVTAVDMLLTDLSGDVLYADYKFDGTLQAKINDQDTTLEVSTPKAGDVQVYAEVKATAQDLLPPSMRSNFAWLRGTTGWDLTVWLPGIAEHATRKHVTVSARSLMKGVTVDFPQPVGKPEAAEIRPLSVLMDMDLKGGVEADIRYMNQLQARLDLSESQASGVIVLNKPLPQEIPSSTLHVSGHLERADLEEWNSWWTRNKSGVALMPETVDLEIDYLDAFGYGVPQMEISMRLDGPEYAVRMNAPSIRGDLRIPKRSKAPIKGDFGWLHLPALGGDGEDVEQVRPDPQEIPPLHLTFDDLQLGTYRLHDVVLETSPGEQQLKIDRLDVESEKFHAQLTGFWQLADGKHLTQLQGLGHSDDLHQTLNYWAVVNPLRAGVMDTKISLQWPGAPQDYVFAEARGEFNLKGRDGRIRNVAPELARILALLNLERIFDRLSLDFDDVLRGGFTYQSAEGQFAADQGNLYTKGFRIVGPSAQFLIAGRIGVDEEDYDLRVVATPETSVLLPVAAGAVAGPIGIGAAYLTNQLLEMLGFGINQTTVVTYEVTGSWSDPIIEEVSEERPADE